MEEIRQHFSLPKEDRRRRRAPYNHSMIMEDPEIREALHKVFRKKCAYCESLLEFNEANISHFRPVSNATSSAQEMDSPDHYAWLAYEWRNLLLLCDVCSTSQKNFFPVEGPRALPLTTWNEAVISENALLLDPCSDEPQRHLSFSGDGYVYPKTKRGRATIELLHLNRPNLISERARIFAGFRQNAENLNREGANTFLDPDLPHAGALRIFIIGLCRAIYFAKQIRLPVDNRSLLSSVMSISSILSESEWQTTFYILDDLARSDDISYEVNSLFMVDEARNRLREQPILRRIVIENFKGIDRIDISLLQDDRSKSGTAPCATLIGENSVGKSSILQATALTLMNSKNRRALRLDPEDYVSRDIGSWRMGPYAMPAVALHFEGGTQSRLTYREPVTGPMIVEDEVPCIILAYGSRRFFVNRGAKRKGNSINKTLFDPLATLPDPGIWLNKAADHVFDAVARAMREILVLRSDDEISRTEDGNILVRAHGRETPIEQMSDGYRSLFAMAIDIMRNLLEYWDNLEYARAIVLIDEIETHLHPRWKMQVMPALRKAMPQVQFIVTTHDPLCLRGMKNGEVHVLYRNDSGNIRAVDDLPNIETLRAEQILTSDYFGLWTTADEDQEEILTRLAALGGKTERELNNHERQERDRLLRKFSGIPLISSSPDRQILAEALTRHLRIFNSVPLGERASYREDAIDQIMAVLERAMGA